MRKQSTTTKRILAYMAKNPDAKASAIAQKYGVHISRVYQLRKKAEDESRDAFVKEMGIEPLPVPEVKKGGFDIEKFRLTPEIIAEMDRKAKARATNVDTVLDSRAKDYGKFIEGAEIMQMLKRMVHNFIDVRGTQLAFDQRESIDMIIHKLGRIINGNPDKVDHWTDIAGYAKLVADRLEGRVR